MANVKNRLDKLEQAIKPGKGESAPIWETSDYKDQASLDKAIEKWDRDNPEEKRGPETVRHIIVNLGFKGDVENDK